MVGRCAWLVAIARLAISMQLGKKARKEAMTGTHQQQGLFGPRYCEPLTSLQAVGPTHT